MTSKQTEDLFSAALTEIQTGSPWKRDTHKSCPHGLRVFTVDGTYVRNTFDSDFTQGGNGFAYSFVPRTELWIDVHIPKVEWPFVLAHECEETELMRGGMGYSQAHQIAKEREDAARAKTDDC